MRSRPWGIAAAAATMIAAMPAVAAAAADPAELRCLALNVYWEARSETPEDQMAIAHATLNRVKSPDFPDTICDVVRQGGEDGACQFSWWCDGAPDEPLNAEAWAAAQRVARAALNGEVPDPTGGAVYYHLDTIEPDWAGEMRQTAVIGPHVFYKGE
ncbi:MAG TPA: cell wall hydrolase [Alphaproteobacteria bacterium]|nr:cell wall hydrolase [Alphaproteobacteria bacterium]